MKLRNVMSQVRYAKEKLAEQNAGQRWLARKTVPLTQPLGFTIVGDHFYEPIPNITYVDRHYDEKARELPAISWNAELAAQMESVASPFIAEYLASNVYKRYANKNFFYDGWDAAYYYCLIRHSKPRLITEVGRGISTWIAGEAIGRNTAEGYPGEIVSIDPYFRGDSSSSCMRLVTTDLQRISPGERKDLLRADIFFVDSSHVAKWGSDVVQLFLLWIPQVREDALVHIHDIFTPYEYPRDWLVRQKRFWNEQYIFESFMAFNTAFQIECAMFWLSRAGHLKRIAAQIDALPLATAHGTAMWLRRVRSGTTSGQT